MAPVGRLYSRTRWRTIWRPMWRGIWRTVWRGIWRTIWRGIGAPTGLGYGARLAPAASGWLGYGVQGVARLWRMVGAYGVWLAPVACRVRIVWTVYSVRLSCLCVVHVSCLCVVMVAPICRHGCAYMPTW